MIHHHKGFAYDYAARRSDLGPLASGLSSTDLQGDSDDDLDSDDKETSSEEKQEETPASKQSVSAYCIEITFSNIMFK